MRSTPSQKLGGAARNADPKERVRAALATIALVVVVVLVGAPLVGWPPVVRLPVVVAPALVLALLVVRPWRWRETELRALDRWEPRGRVVLFAALIAGLVLFWLVLTRFQSGAINAVDFTVYFDRPCFQTLQGRPLYVETADAPGFSHRSELAVHAYWGMLPVCSVYALYPSPLWLLALSVIAVVAGGVHVRRIMQRIGAGGALASATALAFILNDNTARALNYGFHPEVLFAWFVPWMIDAALRRQRRSFSVAMLACALVKEDAVMPIFAASVALGLHAFRRMTWSDRLLFLFLPTAVAAANLGIYYGYVVPKLTDAGTPTYAHFWANYGATPMLALVGMLTQPWRVLVSTMTSGFWTTVIVPHLFLPVLGWRWVVGIVPIVALYGASANEQLRAFGIYYAIVLGPFLAIAASAGALTLFRRLVANAGHARLAAAAAIFLGALLVGSGDRGYSLRPWKSEVAAVPEALDRLANEPVVLVQSGLYPHAGYDERVQLLTPETLEDARDTRAVVLLAPDVSAYPFDPSDLADLTLLRPLRAMPPGILAVRLPEAHTRSWEPQPPQRPRQ
ncbi:MAG: DUF2079 domain-containing protein [Luteitalea sp.]|nr:DUF2079 domain-containing protein [Luteitalea sp.]